VSPIYYVTFTTAVLTASFVLFQGFNATDGIKTTSLLCGFFVIFSGVYLLNFPENRLDARRSYNRVENGDTDGTGLGASPRSSEETQCEDRTALIHPCGERLNEFRMQDLSRIDDEEEQSPRR
jgi:magnesium transporter